MQFISATKKSTGLNIWSQLECQVYLFHPKSLDEPVDQYLDIEALSKARICSTDKIIRRVIHDLAAIGRDKVMLFIVDSERQKW